MQIRMQGVHTLEYMLEVHAGSASEVTSASTQAALEAQPYPHTMVTALLERVKHFGSAPSRLVLITRTGTELSTMQSRDRLCTDADRG
jgi:hypothetical protein